MEIVVLAPVFEDGAAARFVFAEIAATLGHDVVVVAVDDGSVVEPVEPSWIAEGGLSGVVLTLVRNVGHQRAIATGLSYVAENLTPDVVVIMDSDGEDRPDTVPDLLKCLEQSGVDIAVAARVRRLEGPGFRIGYAIYRWIFRLLTGRRISFGNFMAIRGTHVRRLAAAPDLWIHVAGTAIASRLRIAEVPIKRGLRYSGRSSMSFVAFVLHGFKALMIFAEDVLVRLGVLCAIIAGVCVLAAAAAVLLKLFDVATPGWFSVALGLLVVVFLQTGAITLMTLLLTGIAGVTRLLPVDRDRLIARISATEACKLR